MLIAILYQILIHPFLLPPAPKCMVKHQYLKDQSINCFLNFYTVYLPILYSSQAPRPLTDLFVILPAMYWLNCPNHCILRSDKYLFIYNTSYIASSRLYNKLWYMILIGTPTQHHIWDHQPVAGCIIAILASLTHYSIYMVSNLFYVYSYAVSKSNLPPPPTPCIST